MKSYVLFAKEDYSCFNHSTLRILLFMMRNVQVGFLTAMTINNFLSTFTEFLAWMDCWFMAIVLGSFHQFCTRNCIFNQCELLLQY